MTDDDTACQNSRVLVIAPHRYADDFYSCAPFRNGHYPPERVNLYLSFPSMCWKLKSEFACGTKNAGGRMLKRILFTGLVGGMSLSGFGQTLQLLSTKAEGDGAIQLRWQSETNGIYRIECTTALIATNNWKILAEDVDSHGTNTTFLDTGRYWEEPELNHPSFDSQRFYRVAKVGTNQLQAPVVTLDAPASGNVSGEVTITATALTTNSISSIKFFVDGEEVSEVNVPDSGTASYTINTTEWPNGPHNIFAVAKITSGNETTGTPSTVANGAGASAYVPVTFDNYISKWFFSHAIFEPSLEQTQRITATFKAYSDWTLEIRDQANSLVRSASGQGYTMAFDWDGQGESNQTIPDGEYAFSLTASEGTPPQPSPIDPGPGGPPSPMMAAMAAGESTYLIQPTPMPPVKVDGQWRSWEEIYGPQPAVERSISDTAFTSFVLSSLGLDNTMLEVNAQPGGQTTQNPRRPAPKVIKGKPGTVGVVYQGHHPSSGGYARPSNLTGFVTLTPNYVIPYGPLARVKDIANGFASSMNKAGWKTAFNYGNDQVAGAYIRRTSKGGSNLFNFCNIGLLVGHGIRGSSQDFKATSTPSLQTYFPFYKTGTSSYDWVRISECSFGGGTAPLRWMGIYACNMLYYDNAQDMYSKGVLPMNRNLHILCGEETSIYMYPEMGRLWSNFMNGRRDNVKHTVIDSWILASQVSHGQVQPSITVTMSCAYWPSCFNDKLLDYSENESTDPSDIHFRRVTVYPTLQVIE